MKGIIFSTDMVRAILDGRKSQTRRIVNGFGSHGIANGRYIGWKGQSIPIPYKINDILWVRETWLYCMTHGRYFYKASVNETTLGNLIEAGFNWKPSIFMPHRAARIFLEVKSVRIERLQDIGETDCIEEGVTPVCAGVTETCYTSEGCLGCNRLYTTAFIKLWDSINAKRGYSWNSNPYVWVIEFTRGSGNE
ncbi:MAG: hypothetical protein FWH53_00325 [Leptospirales bacterium]|nr:hypothetical protein [Leptospirales bacterium]